MSTTNDNAKLFELNYQAQLDALREIGLLGANETIGLGEIADRMQWAGGFLDACRATVNKTTGQLTIFTDDEWDGMSINQQGNYVTIGVRVRAERQCFLISKDDMKTSSGGYTMKWSNENVNVPGLTDYGADNSGMYDDFDAAGMTDAIVEFAEARGVEYLPGQLSRAYKACTVAADGVDDPVEWSCATIAHLRLMCKYRAEINDTITRHIGSSFQLKADWYWSANEHSAGYSPRFHLGSGFVNIPGYLNAKSNGTSRVRAVSAL